MGAPTATEPGDGLEDPATAADEAFAAFRQPAPDAGAAQGRGVEAGESPPGERDTSHAAHSPPEPETEEDKTAAEPAFARVTGSEADDAAVEENVSDTDTEVPFADEDARVDGRRAPRGALRRR